MKGWLNNLSKKQIILLLSIILFSVFIIIAGELLTPKKATLELSDFSYKKSIKYNADKLGVTGKNLAKELGLDISVSKNKPINQLGVSQEVFEHSIEHLLGHKDATIKYYIYFVLFIFAFFYLINLGKPEKLDNKYYRKKYPRAVYNIVLIITVITTGFLLGKSPNPMESGVKVFKTMVGLYPDPINKVMAFIFFIILSVIGNKLICGWACPFGALQELFYSVPIFNKIKKVKLPFILTNSIRITIFIIMLLFLFGIIGDKKGLVIYHYINPFNLFNLDFDYPTILAVVVISLVGGLIIYRPFCNFICPFGLISWIFERVSIFKVRVNFDLCNKCNACVKACPTEAMKGIIENKKIYADCFSCGRCLNVCAKNAIDYRGSFIINKKN